MTLIQVKHKSMITYKFCNAPRLFNNISNKRNFALIL